MRWPRADVRTRTGSEAATAVATGRSMRPLHSSAVKTITLATAKQVDSVALCCAAGRRRPDSPRTSGGPFVPVLVESTPEKKPLT